MQVPSNCLEPQVKRLIICLGIFFFLIDLASDGCPGKPRSDLKLCPSKLCTDCQDHLDDCCSGDNELIQPKPNFKIDLQIANFSAVSSQNETRLGLSGFQVMPQLSARTIIVICHIGGSGAIPLDSLSLLHPFCLSSTHNFLNSHNLQIFVGRLAVGSLLAG